MKNTSYILLGILLLLLGWCTRDYFSDEPKVIIKEKDEYTVTAELKDSLVKEYVPKYDSLKNIAKLSDSVATQALTRVQLLERSLEASRKKKDTVQIVQYQDSIITVKDTVIVELQLSGRVKDSLITIQHDLIVSLDSLNNINDSLYYELDQSYKESVEERTKFKKQRNRARIAVGGFVLFEVVRAVVKNK